MKCVCLLCEKNTSTEVICHLSEENVFQLSKPFTEKTHFVEASLQPLWGGFFCVKGRTYLGSEYFGNLTLQSSLAVPQSNRCLTTLCSHHSAAPLFVC